MTRPTFGLVAVCVAVVLAACGSAKDPSSDDRPTIAVTTNILADVVGEIVGDQAEVITIMPVGSDPHDFQPSAQEIDRLLSADALVTNGAGFEEGLLDVITSASSDGLPNYEAISAVATLAREGDDHDEHEDEDEDEALEDAAPGTDPHFFTDPVRMSAAVQGIAAFLGDTIDGLDITALETATTEYTRELAALDTAILELVDRVEPDRRILVTNHEVFAYFAERYGFEVAGTVIPGSGTTDAPSAGELADLAQVIEAEGVPAIFADTSSTNQLVDALAAEVGEIAVVELYSESLGEPGSDGSTYVDMMRTNARRITDALI